MDIGQILVIGLSLVLGLWFLGGTWYNRRRARQIWHWLEPGLDVFGGQVGKVWIGSSGAGLRVAIDRASPPFRRLELVVRLESRENLPLWLFEVARGQRDQLTLRATLRSFGRTELEAVPLDRPLTSAPQAPGERTWDETGISPRWRIAHRGRVGEEQIDAVRGFISVYTDYLQRLALRRAEPQLLVQISLSGVTEELVRQLSSRIKAMLSS
jgi:hypothetical protein